MHHLLSGRCLENFASHSADLFPYVAFPVIAWHGSVIEFPEAIHRAVSAGLVLETSVGQVACKIDSTTVRILTWCKVWLSSKESQHFSKNKYLQSANCHNVHSNMKLPVAFGVE